MIKKSTSLDVEGRKMDNSTLNRSSVEQMNSVDGFPIGRNEDIIALSAAPNYTACPNPFLYEFVRKYGVPYNEETDDYQCEPFSSDISEGKSDPIYKAHSYHTKVPYKAIKKYIMHYTKPGDLILDAYCGTGMTGVAAQNCKYPDDENISLFDDANEKHYGARKAILVDLSPVAAFIAYNCNRETDPEELTNEIQDWLTKSEEAVGWVYKTKHTDNSEGTIKYTVWSQTVICPQCGKSSLFYDLETQNDVKTKGKMVSCPYCGAKMKKVDFQRSLCPEFDSVCNEQVNYVEKHPVIIFYTLGGKTYQKTPDKYDLELLEKIKASNSKWFPTEKMMFKGSEWGKEYQPSCHVGITRVNHFFSKRNLIVLSELFDNAKKYKYCSLMQELIISSLPRASIRNRYMPEYGNKHVGPLSGTLYVPRLSEENNLFDAIRGRAKKVINASRTMKCSDNDFIVSTGSVTQLNIPDNSIDYIFTDPPFGHNLVYSELNFISESWLKIYTNNMNESIICKAQNKGLNEYSQLMRKGFEEYFRVLKPNRWITVEFHNSHNSVWNIIREAIQAAGFIIADVRVLDKKKGTTKQLIYSMAVKQDLVISAYKPKDTFRKEIVEKIGTEETAWAFVRQHLSNLPVVVDSDNNGRLDIISERQSHLLFDRMVAYHIMNGFPIPINASDFYNGLDERFILRDGMYFLPDQVNEYDIARIKMDVEPIQLGLFVTNERSAIAWLYGQLEIPQTYAELQPKFLQEVKSVDRYEEMPELQTLLEENFIQDDKSRWYIPDRTKESDIEKLREKNLWKEFEGYLSSKGKLKQFRSEAIRLGFSRLWKDKNYTAIVALAQRLPEQTIQEDSNLMMYYDISLSRV